ncbi:MAG: restriction endonuclease subunit S [Nostocales cyanobacterium 94392]|nr:restriction endonuclease subunit S [Nostocales cyanobacterium 94392]
MAYPVLSLEEITQKISQGITLSRYQDNEGSSEQVVNTRNLEYLHIEGELNIVKLDASNLAQYRLCAGDVVVTIRGTPLKASVVAKEVEGTLVGQNLAVLRLSAHIHPVYLAIVMRSKWLELQLAPLYSQSSGTRLIKISQLRDMKIPLPDLDTQNKIAQLFIAAERYTRSTLEVLAIRNNLTEFALSQILEGRQ